MDEDLSTELLILGAQLNAADEVLVHARQTADAAGRRNPAFNYEPRLSVILNTLRTLRAELRELVPQGGR